MVFLVGHLVGQTVTNVEVLNKLADDYAAQGEVNAEKVKLSGNKWKDKKYYRHSGYMGGMTETSAEELLEKKPTDLLTFAVKGMLPKNSLGRKQLKKLKVYAGTEHPHEAQQPETLSL